MYRLGDVKSELFPWRGNFTRRKSRQPATPGCPSGILGRPQTPEWVRTVRPGKLNHERA